MKNKFQEIVNKLKKENNYYKLTKQESIEINNKINSEMQEVRRDFRKRSFESELEASKIIINT
jgi:hypothetical protein